MTDTGTDLIGDEFAEPELPAEQLPWKPSEAVAVRDPQDTPLDIAVLTPRGVQWYARVFIESGMFPDVKTMAQASAKILAGREKGLQPFEAMRSLNIIKGNTAFTAGYISSKVKSSGKYDYAIRETTDMCCRLEWFQRGGPLAKRQSQWVSVGTSEFTEADARKAGLWGRGQWTAYTTDMLYNRALTRGARRFAPDCFDGAVYVPEELGAGAGPEQYADDGIAFGEAGGAG